MSIRSFSQNYAAGIVAALLGVCSTAYADNTDTVKKTTVAPAKGVAKPAANNATKAPANTGRGAPANMPGRGSAAGRVGSTPSPRVGRAPEPAGIKVAHAPNGAEVHTRPNGRVSS